MKKFKLLIHESRQFKQDRVLRSSQSISFLWEIADSRTIARMHQFFSKKQSQKERSDDREKYLFPQKANDHEK
jgi:hypothetical protein